MVPERQRDGLRREFREVDADLLSWSDDRVCWCSDLSRFVQIIPVGDGNLQSPSRRLRAIPMLSNCLSRLSRHNVGAARSGVVARMFSRYPDGASDGLALALCARG